MSRFLLACASWVRTGTCVVVVTFLGLETAPLPGRTKDQAPRLAADGQAWFPLGILVTPITRQRRLELADAGFDLVRLSPMAPGPMREALDSLRASGLRASVPVGPWLGSKGPESTDARRSLRTLVDAVGAHPALALWESVDEPAWTGQAERPLRAGHEFLRRIDPAHSIWTNQAPRGPLSKLIRYNQATDVAGSDIYPVSAPARHSDLPNRTLSVVGDETARSLASVDGKKPVIMILQGFAWRDLEGPDHRAAVYPTFEESRFMAYDAIIAGAAGLVWWSPDETWPRGAFWGSLKRLVSELRGIIPLLEATDASSRGRARLLGKPSSVRMSERLVGAHRAVLLINRAQRRARIMIRTGGTPAERWHVLLGDPPASQRSDTLVVDLPPWGVRVLSNDAAAQPRRRDFVTAESTSRPARAESPSAGLRESSRNGSFEQEDPAGMPSGWVVRDPTFAYLDRQGPHSGARSLRLAAESEGLRALVVQRKIPVVVGRRYRLSAWMRSDTPAARASFYAEWVRDGSFHTHELPWTAPGPRWTQRHVAFVATPDSQSRIYVVLAVAGPGRVWFDDVQLKVVR